MKTFAYRGNRTPGHEFKSSVSYAGPLWLLTFHLYSVEVVIVVCLLLLDHVAMFTFDIDDQTQAMLT